MQPRPSVRDSGLDAVIGMYPTVHRSRTVVVAPWTAYSLGDNAVRPPRRILVHGPAGCGVTFVARCLVDELGTVAGVPAALAPSVDDDAADLEQLLSSSAVRDVVLVAVSHRPWDLPASAFDDDGFERMVFVAPPDWDARRFRVWESWGSRLDPADLDRVVVATEGWSGSDLAALDAGSFASVDDLLAHVAATRPGALDWLDAARELVRCHGPRGRLDDLVGYLQRYRLL